MGAGRGRQAAPAALGERERICEGASVARVVNATAGRRCAYTRATKSPHGAGWLFISQLVLENGGNAIAVDKVEQPQRSAMGL